MDARTWRDRHPPHGRHGLLPLPAADAPAVKAMPRHQEERGPDQPKEVKR